MCVLPTCMYIDHVPLWHLQGPGTLRSPGSYIQFWAPMWVLGIKPRSSGRIANPLNL